MLFAPKGKAKPGLRITTRENDGSLEDPAIMSSCNTNVSTQPLQQALADFLNYLPPHPSAIDLSFLLVSCPILAWSFYPRSWGPPFEHWGGNMGLALVGIVVLVLCAISYALRVAMGEEDRAFQDRKDLYRSRRDAFRNDPQAMEELKQWKRKNNDLEYKKLASGLIPANMIGKDLEEKDPEKADYGQKLEKFAKADTWFSEFETHNKKSMILSESPHSYIIGNLHSYDSRQYPEWYDAKNRPGINTPEGQGFGHTLVISRKRIFNVVDPEATENDCERLKEMKRHFISFWEFEHGSPKLIKRTQSAFDDQNKKLKDKALDAYTKLLPALKQDFDSLAEDFSRLRSEDFECAFHAHPDNSVGHLHMHVFPKKEYLRRFSTKSHDWKTIPLDAVLEVEREDKMKLATETNGAQECH